jgi:heme-degrading monooxygenase HmoA
MSSFNSKPLVHINILTPKPGRLDDFISSQLEGRPSLAQIRGLSTSRLYRAEDGSRAIVVAGFDCVEAYEEFQKNPAFQAERARLKPLLEGVQAAFYRLIYDRSGG